MELLRRVSAAVNVIAAPDEEDESKRKQLALSLPLSKNVLKI